MSSSTTLLTLKDGSTKSIGYNLDSNEKTLTFKSLKTEDSISIAVEYKINTWNIVNTVLVLFNMDDMFDSDSHHYGITLSGFESEKEFFETLENCVLQKKFEEDHLHSGSGATNDCKTCDKMNQLGMKHGAAVVLGTPSAAQKDVLRMLGFK